MPSYIPDGYTLQALIAAVPRLHDALHFTYRPALIEEAADLYEKARKQTDRQAERTYAGFVASKLVSWDLKDNTGKELPVNQDTILHLNRRLATRLQNIVLGLEGPDEGDEIDAEAERKN